MNDSPRAPQRPDSAPEPDPTPGPNGDESPAPQAPYGWVPPSGSASATGDRSHDAEPTMPLPLTVGTDPQSQDPLRSDPYRAASAPPAAQRPPWEQPTPVRAAPQKSRKPLAAAALVGVLVLGAGAGAGGAWFFTSQEQGNATRSSTISSVVNNGTPAVASGSVEEVATNVLPSVVKIEVTGGQGGGSGSGIVLSSDGEILTNNHVVEVAGTSGSIMVAFNDGTRAPAKVVGTDPLTDTALIKAEGVSDLTPATLGTSGDLRVGQEVVAIGSPFGLNATVTSGIVSALNRPVSVGTDAGGNSTTYPAIQTDAAINPGNSGGPLVDMNGRVIGINSSIRTASDGQGAAGSIGLGFAIPMDEVVPIVEQMRAGDTPTHARLGIGVDPRDTSNSTSGQSGALVTQVTPGSTADKAGLKDGDVITRVNDTIIEGADSLIATVRSYRPGEKVTVVWQRDGKEKQATLSLDSDKDSAGTSQQTPPQQQQPQQAPSENTNPFEGFGN